MGGIRESIESHGHVAWIFNPSRGPHSGFYRKAPLGDHCPLAAWPPYYLQSSITPHLNPLARRASVKPYNICPIHA
eukprot:4539081-Prymnesium_polylepis.1